MIISILRTKLRNENTSYNDRGCDKMNTIDIAVICKALGDITVCRLSKCYLMERSVEAI